MSKDIYNEHVVLFINDEGAEALFKRINLAKEKSRRNKQNEWRYETCLETEKEFLDLRRFVVMYADCISSIEAGEKFKNSIKEYIQDAMKSLGL